ncbi:unnamed protein product [Arabis nemorensis]|uniref:RRM domain-containing protein n=1 Tax=Arabis nemorensis TaxID=586526 RepID=A0A565B402_9BRAS|nr:unnamed protein product [Arabis nemorensis]
MHCLLSNQRIVFLFSTALRDLPSEVALLNLNEPLHLQSLRVLESLVLHIDTLSRNVNEGHLKEIFGNFGEIIHVELAIDRAVNLPRGYAYVEFKARADAEKAQLYMDGAQIDGKVVKAKFTLPPRQKVSPPIKPVSSAAKGDAKKSDNVVADIEKDGPGCLKETSPQPKSLLSPRRRSPLHKRGGSPRGLRDSPPPRRLESPIRCRAEPPSRGRSPSSPRLRSPPRGDSPQRIRGSSARSRSPLPFRRRSPPRRQRSPPRRSPIRRRSRSPVRRPARSRSRSISPRRGKGPAGRRRRSSSYSSSPSPRKASRRISRSRSRKRYLYAIGVMRCLPGP